MAGSLASRGREPGLIFGGATVGGGGVGGGGRGAGLLSWPLHAVHGRVPSIARAGAGVYIWWGKVRRGAGGSLRPDPEEPSARRLLRGYSRGVWTGGGGGGGAAAG